MTTPEEALEAAQVALEAAESSLGAVKRETADRAARLKGVGLDSGMSVGEIRELADQVNLVDPASVEDAQIAAAEAAVVVARARQAALDAQRPALEAEKDRLEAIAAAAAEEARAARNAWMRTLPRFSDATNELRDASDRLQAARRAAQAGAARRLAILTGTPEPTAPAARSSLTEHALVRYM